MEPLSPFSSIRVIGFDLDQTLYPKSPLIDEKIQSYLYEKIVEHAHVSPAQAEQLFKERYREGAGMSGSQTLADLGLARASELVQEALENADLTSVLVPDPEINSLLALIKDRYEAVDLITGSNLKHTEDKLTALNIPLPLFSHIITADDGAKSTGESYRIWLSRYPHLTPDQFLYIGDRLRSDHEIPSTLGIQTALVYVSAQSPAIPCPQFTSLREALESLLV